MCPSRTEPGGVTFGIRGISRQRYDPSVVMFASILIDIVVRNAIYCLKSVYRYVYPHGLTDFYCS